MCTVCCTGFLYGISAIAIWTFRKSALAAKAMQRKTWKGLSALMQWFFWVFTDKTTKMPWSILAVITCLRSQTTKSIQSTPPESLYTRALLKACKSLERMQHGSKGQRIRTVVGSQGTHIPSPGLPVLGGRPEKCCQPSSCSFPQLSELRDTSCGSWPCTKFGDPAGRLETRTSNPDLSHAQNCRQEQGHQFNWQYVIIVARSWHTLARSRLLLYMITIYLQHMIKIYSNTGRLELRPG